MSTVERNRRTAFGASVLAGAKVVAAFNAQSIFRPLPAHHAATRIEVTPDSRARINQKGTLVAGIENGTRTQK